MTFEPHSEQPPAVSDSGPDAPCPHTVTAAARASFLRRTFHSPIQRRRAACALYGLADDREFFALVEHLKASAKAAFSEHWSPRRAKLNKGLFDLLQALLKHADFAFGARVAQRLSQARDEATKEATRDRKTAPGTALALRNKELELRDHYRQNSKARGTWQANRASAGYSSAARRAGDRAGRQARLGSSPELPGARTRLPR